MEGSYVILEHNLNPKKFIFLWMKYVTGFNEKHHCTNCLKGRYSRKLSKPNNPSLSEQSPLVFDEFPIDTCKALYICGVSSKRYREKLNYPYNLHAPILPIDGRSDELKFDSWHLRIKNGIFLPVPGENELIERYQHLPPEFTTCRIFRWAANYFEK